MARKNEKIKNLNSPVPNNTRIEVYKEAIYHIKNDIPVADLGIHGLCLILPCLLWGLEKKHHCSPDGEPWCFGQTHIAFPELTEDIMLELTIISSHKEVTNKRLYYLQKFIHDLEESPFYERWWSLAKHWFRITIEPILFHLVLGKEKTAWKQ